MSTQEITKNEKPPSRKEVTSVLLLATLSSSFGTFQAGYSLWMVHNPAAILLEFPNSTFEKSSLGTRFREKLLGFSIIIFPIGGLIGALFISYLVDTWGRKGALVINNCLNIFAASFMVLSKVVHTLKFSLFARFVNGLSSGIFSCIVPLYLGEISPPKLRGCLNITSMLALTFGILVAQLLSLREAFGTTEGISFLMSFTGIMAVLNIIMLHYSPESPRFLFIQKRNRNEAKQALMELRGSDNVEEELEDLCQEDLYEKSEKNMNLFQLFDSHDLRWSIISTVILMAGNQLTGVNAAYLYAERIYRSLGLKGSAIRYILISVNGILHMVILVLMLIIDSVGRRFLLLLGFIICSMICIFLAMVLEFQVQGQPVMAYFSTFLLITFLIGHMIGPGPIPYLLTGELFLQSSRGSAYMVGGFMNWFTRFLVGVMFVFVEPKIGPLSLLIFWPISIAIFMYVLKMVPETKGKTFLEIRKRMDAPPPKRLRKKSEHKKAKPDFKKPK